MTILNPAQRAFIHSKRKLLWTRPFYVEEYAPLTPTDYYDPENVTNPTVTVFSGSWVWKDQMEMSQREAGIMVGADLILNTDILHSGALAHKDKRIRVEDQLCTVVRFSTYDDTGELVLVGKRVK